MPDKSKRTVAIKHLYFLNSKVTEEEIENGVKDEYGVIYCKDGKRLLKCPDDICNYHVKSGTLAICDEAFIFVRLSVCPNIDKHPEIPIAKRIIILVFMSL